MMRPYTGRFATTRTEPDAPPARRFAAAQIAATDAATLAGPNALRALAWLRALLADRRAHLATDHNQTALLTWSAAQLESFAQSCAQGHFAQWRA
jgi:hypothetical protein